MSINVKEFTLVLFGITGDLAGKKTLPALFNLYRQGKFIEDFRLVGVGRSAIGQQELELKISKSIENVAASEQEKNDFIQRISYLAGNYDDPTLYAQIKRAVSTNTLFYISLPPFVYEHVITGLGAAKLISKSDTGSTLMIEKPFGTDIESAQKLNKLISTYASEKQILRIDHYLGKRALLGLLIIKTNGIAHTLSGYKAIKIECTIFEKNLVEGRGSFYDSTGALKDVGQNHLIQMLVAATTFINKNKKASSLEDIINTLSIKQILRGQYEGYTQIEGVTQNSSTETFFRIIIKRKIEIVLQAGKALDQSRSEIRIQFINEKKQTAELRADFNSGTITIVLPDSNVEFNLKGDFYPKEAYEKIIFDGYKRNIQSFAKFKEINESWKFISHIEKKMQNTPLKIYKVGTNPDSLI